MLKGPVRATYTAPGHDPASFRAWRPMARPPQSRFQAARVTQLPPCGRGLRGACLAAGPGPPPTAVMGGCALSQPGGPWVTKSISRRQRLPLDWIRESQLIKGKQPENPPPNSTSAPQTHTHMLHGSLRDTLRSRRARTTCKYLQWFLFTFSCLAFGKSDKDERHGCLW